MGVLNPKVVDTMLQVVPDPSSRPICTGLRWLESAASPNGRNELVRTIRALLLMALSASSAAISDLDGIPLPIGVGLV